jgi:predicted ABC-type ATPase
MNTASPQLYIIAGLNGSGKTTFVQKFLPRYAGCLNFVNADLIASGLSPFSPDVVAIRAGKIMLEQIHSYARQGQDFAFETTLAGRSYVALLNQLRQQGYEIHLYFLWLRHIAIATRRIAERVSQGGHHVPGDVVRRRFQRGLENFFRLYDSLADSWIIFDNSEETPRVVAYKEGGKVMVTDHKLYRMILRRARRHVNEEQ